MNITDQAANVKFELSSGKTFYLKKGSARAQLSSEMGFVVLDRESTAKETSRPIVNIRDAGGIGTVTDADANDVTPSTLLELIRIVGDWIA